MLRRAARGYAPLASHVALPPRGSVIAPWGTSHRADQRNPARVRRSRADVGLPPGAGVARAGPGILG